MPHTHKKDHLCFYKNSTNQTFCFINNKVVLFKNHVSRIEPLGNEISTAIKRSVSPPEN